MKMIATTGAAPIEEYAAYVHNCLRNVACEPPWAAPLPGVPYLQLYVDFGAYKPATYELRLQDMCDLNHTDQLFASNYIVGQTPEGNWYGVFKYFTSPLVPVTNFVAWLSVLVYAPGGLMEKTYFSELLQVEPCEILTKIKACYPEGATETGFDLLNVYYGLPVNSDFLGFDGIRYFHIAYTRRTKARELSAKVTFTSNLIRTFRSSVERTWSLETELVPKWYYHELLAIYLRGALSLDDGPTYLVSDVNAEGINDDDLTWKPFATLTQTTRQFFGCDTSVCVECCSPRVVSATSTTCCNPTVVDATVQVVDESASASASASVPECCAPTDAWADQIILEDLSNEVTVNFVPCDPAPALGYRLRYRAVGDVSYITWPVNFTSAPAVFDDGGVEDPGTFYEGTIEADCGGGNFGEPVVWQNRVNGVISMDLCTDADIINDVRFDGESLLNIGGSYPVEAGDATTLVTSQTGTHTVEVDVAGSPVTAGSVLITDSDGNVQCQNFSAAGTLSFPGVVFKYGSPWSALVDCAPCMDADARAFITATGIVDSDQKTAINDLVVNLKLAGVWTKLRAIYPMVGGTAFTHKFNLKDPRDLDAAYRLTFAGTWVHDANGAQPDGATAWTNTHLDPSVVLTTSNGMLGYYSRTDQGVAEIEMGAIAPGFLVYQIVCRYNTNLSYYNWGGTIPNVANTDGRGLFCTNRLSSTNTEGYRNGVQVLNAADSSAVVPYEIYIGARNDSGTALWFTSKQCAFAMIGDGLTSGEHSDLYIVVQGFQSALGRSV